MRRPSVPPLFPTFIRIRSLEPTPLVDLSVRLDPTPEPPITIGDVRLVEALIVVAPPIAFAVVMPFVNVVVPADTVSPFEPVSNPAEVMVPVLVVEMLPLVEILPTER